MKNLILIACSLITVSCLANDSNLVVNVNLPHQDFLANSASYSDTTNAIGIGGNTNGIEGYIYYPSLIQAGVTVTRWQFPNSIITSTNPIIECRVLTTNAGQIPAGFYRLTIYTNNGTVPYYDSNITPILWQNLIGVTPSNPTNIETIKITNNLPTTFLTQKSNITYGSVSFRMFNGSATNTIWMLGGKIIFE